MPLQTLRVPIDFGFAEARTTWGVIGVKCWINKKEDAGNAAGSNRRPGAGTRRGGRRH